MSDTLTPERLAELRGHRDRVRGRVIEISFEVHDDYKAIFDSYDSLIAAAEENATLRSELATWKHRAGSKWSQHDIDQAKKIGNLTNDLFAAYASRDAALAEVARLKALHCNPGIPPVS